MLSLHKESPSEASAPIISKLMTAFDLKDNPNSKSNQLSLYAVMKKLLDLALSFDTNHEGATLSSFLRHITELRSEAKVPDYVQQGYVQILTCHHSKGLEFPVVFVIDVQLGIFANDFFIETMEALGAERRLFYVAITRAKKALFLIAYSDPEWQPSRPEFELNDYFAPMSPVRSEAPYPQFSGISPPIRRGSPPCDYSLLLAQCSRMFIRPVSIQIAL